MTTVENSKENLSEYLIESDDKGTFKIRIPSDWKITYGRVQPSERGQYGSGEFAVRIYKTKENQKAVFTSVRAFRSLEVEVYMPEGFDDGIPVWVPQKEGQEIFAKESLNAIRGEKNDEKTEAGPYRRQ